MKSMKTTLSTMLIALSTALPAGAAHLQYYSAMLDSSQSTTGSDSMATGKANLTVDTIAQTLSFSMTVDGIGTDDLWDTLVAAPVGPVHLHNAAAGSTGPIVIPFAFGADTYSGMGDMFGIDVSDYAYADAVALSGSSLSFEEFVAELDMAGIYVNIHTDTWMNGEIRGQVSPVPVPAAGVLLLAALGGLTVLRRRQG